jgi:BirA family biotin operon repressor/biotin-[acetyl-CoA-carboxylase] ligase
MNEAGPRLPKGFRLHRYDTIGSTNDEARHLARDGAPEGTLVWSLAQTAGKGRRGRVWLSPPGNLYLSLVQRPAAPPAQAAQLGFVAAIALGDALDRLAGPVLRLRYKWPNDLLIDGGKIAGILLESETAAADVADFVIVGIGVNLVSAPRDVEFPATSLAAAGCLGVTPPRLLEAFAHCFAGWAEHWREEGFAPVRAAWLKRASGLGEGIRVRLERQTLDGRFLDLDHDGALLLDAAGGRRRIAAGEVFPAQG